MYYSSYVKTMAAVTIGVWILVVALFTAVLGAGGFLLGLLFGLVFLFGFYVSVRWVQMAVDYYGGSPFPGWFGLAGFTIDADPGPNRPILPAPLPPGYAPTPSRSAPWSEAPPGFRPPDAGLSLSDVQACNRCGTITTGAGSKYCRSCRAALDGSETIETTPSVGCQRCGSVTSGRASRFCRVCGAPIS